MEYSKLHYAAPVWGGALQNHPIQKRLFSAQRDVALRIVSGYRTVSKSAVLVLAIVPPIDLLVKERQETFQLPKERTCITDLQENARAKEAIRKMEDTDSSRDDRRDEMVNRPGDGPTVLSRSSPLGCTESTGRSAFT